MKMCNCKHALGYEEETGCAVCGHDGCEYNDTIEQLTARVKELEKDDRPKGIWCMYCGKNWEYIGEEPPMDIVNDAVEHEKTCKSNPYLQRIATLEQQVQQAERRGYELAKAFGTYKWIYGQDGTIVAMDDDIKWNTYEQACAERDGGEKKE